MKLLGDLAAGACALLFLAAFLGKLDGWAQWSRLSEKIPGPAAVGQVARVVVPVMESAIVVLSFASPSVGLAAATVVLTGFAAAVGVLTQRLAGQECNCFGAIAPATISWHLAARNIVLAILAAGGWYAAQHENLQALSLSTVLVTLLFGAIALMVFQFRRLHQATRSASSMPEEVE